MLELLSPLGLAALAVVPLVYWLHRWRSAGDPVTVSALFLWPAHAADATPARRRRQRDPAWRRRAVVGAALAAALAGPMLTRDAPQPPLVWFDTAPAMGTVEADGPREALAVERLLATLDAEGVRRAQVRDPWGTRPPLALEPQQRPLWPAALRQWLAPRGPGADAPPPLPGPRDGRQWLVSDGATEGLAPWAAGQALERVLAVGEALDNAGVAGLAVRPALDGDGLRGLARLVNRGTADTTRRLRLSWPGGTTTLGPLDLAAEDETAVDFPLPASALGGVLGARLEPGDALPTDDVLSLGLAPVPFRTAGRCPPPLLRLLARLPGLEQDAGANPGLGIRCPGAGTGALAVAPTLVLGDGPARGVDGPVHWAPWLRGLGDLVLERKSLAALGVPPAGANWLLAAGPRVLVAETRPGGGPKSLHLHVDLERLHRHDPAGFTLLLSRLLERLVGNERPTGLWQHDAPRGVAAIAPRPLPAAQGAGAGGSAARFDLGRVLLAAALAVLALDLWRARRRAFGVAARVVLGAALLAAWWLPAGGEEAPRRTLLALFDDSASMDPRALELAWSGLRREALQGNGALRLGILRYAGDSALERDPDSADTLAVEFPRPRPLHRDATNLEGALRHAAGLVRADQRASILVVSDGRENQGDAGPVLAALSRIGIPVWGLALEPDPTPGRTPALHAPGRVPTAAAVPVVARFSGPAPGTTVTLRVAGSPHDTLTRDVSPDGATLLATVLAPPPAGPHLLELETGRTPVRAVVNAVGPQGVGYLGREPDGGPLRSGLAHLGAPLAAAQPSGLQGMLSTQGLGLLVLDDVAVTDADPGAWRALARKVRGDGLGLLVLGGPRSFSGGAYRGSVLEDLLPVLAAAPGGRAPAAVQFLVDTSGSMAPGATGTAPIAAARAAVLTTARRLAERDRVGLTVFDVSGRPVLPLTDKAAALSRLEAHWQPATGGGTRLGEAFADAVSALSSHTAGPRLLVLVTDGRLAEGPASADLVRLRRLEARLVILALGQGPGPELTTLAEQAGATLVPVRDSARLPEMVSGAVARELLPPRSGPLEPVVHGAAGLVGDARPLPPWAAARVTRARPEARVPVSTADGLPLVAAWEAGLGRVVAVPGGFGPWGDAWLQWPAWPEALRALVRHVSSGALEGRLHLRLSADGAGTVAWAEAAGDGGWSGDSARLRLRAPDGGLQDLRLTPQAPGRYRTRLDTPVPGVYGLRLTAAGASLVHRFAVPEPGLRERAVGGRDVLTAAVNDGHVRPWPGLEQALAGDAGHRNLRAPTLILALLGLLVLWGLEQTPRARVRDRSGP